MDYASGEGIYGAWCDIQRVAHGSWPCEVVFVGLQQVDTSLSTLVILDILDHVRSGVFHIVCLSPSVSAWTAAHHSEPGNHRLLRSRTEPLGVDGLSHSEATIVFNHNRNSEFIGWFAAQALQCSVRKIASVLVFPEDLGGNVSQSQASLWAMLEYGSLASANDTFRGADFSCQLGIAHASAQAGPLRRSSHSSLFVPTTTLNGRQMARQSVISLLTQDHLSRLPEGRSSTVVGVVDTPRLHSAAGKQSCILGRSFVPVFYLHTFVFATTHSEHIEGSR